MLYCVVQDKESYMNMRRQFPWIIMLNIDECRKWSDK